MARRCANGLGVERRKRIRIAIKEYKSGERQEICNGATRQHGHGKMVLSAGHVMNIGGSTGGKVRRLLDAPEDD